MTEATPTLERRRPGRPRNQPPPEMADEMPELVRETRSNRTTVEGRDGVKLTRKRTGNTDPYAIPQHIIPTGWDYQWNTYTVVGQEAVDSQILMAENGWRPVPAERHAGMFMPEGYKGQILRGGMRLEERPKVLSEEAKREDYERAVGQVRDNNSQFDRTKAKFGRGFEGRKFEGVRTGVDVAADIPRPRLEIDPNN